MFSLSSKYSPAKLNQKEFLNEDEQVCYSQIISELWPNMAFINKPKIISVLVAQRVEMALLEIHQFCGLLSAINTRSGANVLVTFNSFYDLARIIGLELATNTLIAWFRTNSIKREYRLFIRKAANDYEAYVRNALWLAY